MPVEENGALRGPPSGGASTGGSRGLFFVSLLLAAIAYYPVLGSSGGPDAVRELEEWFFVPSEGSAGIVLALSAWLLFRRWGQLRALPDVSRLGPGALIFLFLGVALAFWSYLTGAGDLLVLSMLANGIGLTLLFRGTRGLRVVGFPLAVLPLALPIPGIVFNEIVFQLQLWTAQWAGWLLYQMGFVAHVRGDLIVRPEDTFAIIEGCSGMRSVEALLLLAILVVDTFGRRGLHAVGLIALAPVLAFLLNGFRVLGLIFNPHSEMAAIHNLQGVMILLGGLILLVFADACLARLLPARGASPGGDGEPTPAADAPPASRAPLVGVAVLGVCALLSVAVVPAWTPSSRPVALYARLVPSLPGWAWTPTQTDQEYLGQTLFRESLEGTFLREGEEVDVFVGLGDPGRRTRSFVSPKTAFPGSGWELLAAGESEFPGLGGPFEWKLLASGPRRVLSYRWHRGVGNRTVEALVGAAGLDFSPLRPAGRWGGVVVRIATPVEGPGNAALEAARRRLDTFAIEFEPGLRVLEESLRGKDFS